MQLTKNPIFHARTKHIEVHYHFVHKRFMIGEVELRYAWTDRQVTNIFTKVLGTDKLQHFSKMFGIHHLDLPHFRGRATEEPKKEPTDEGMGRAEEDVESTEDVEPTEENETSGKAKTSGKGDRVKKDKADR